MHRHSTARPAPGSRRGRSDLPIRLVILLAAVLCLSATGLVRGQSGPVDAESAGGEDSAAPAELGVLDAQIARVEADDTLREAAREALLAELNGTRVLLERTETRRSRLRIQEQEAAERDDILAALSAELSAPVTDKRWPAADDPIAVLTVSTAEIEEELVAAMTALFTARREETRLNGRASRIAEEIAETLRRGEGAVRSLPTAASRDGLSPAPASRDASRGTLVEESRELVERLRWRDSLSTVVELRRELATLPARRAIAAARTLLAAERVARLARVLERYRTSLGDARVAAAAADVVAASALVDADATPRGTANLALARRRLELVREEWLAARQLARARTELIELHGVRSTVDSMIGSGLAADDLAGLLRGLDERLPERDRLLAALTEATRERSALQAERFGWDERLRERTVDDPLGVANSLTGSPDMLLGGQPGEPPGGAAARGLDAASGEDGGGSGGEPVIGGTGGVRADGTRLLIALIEDANRLSDLLTEQEIVLQESLARTDNIDTFLSRSLLGLRTGESAGLAWLARTPAGLSRLLDTAVLRDVLAALGDSIARFPLRALMFAALVAALLLLRPRLRRRLGELATRVGNVGRDGHWVTPAALMVSVPRALPLPLLLWFASLQLGLPGELGELTPALGSAIGKVAPVLFALLLVRVLARPDGVLHRHFGWSLQATLALRRHLLWLGWTLLTAGLLLVLAAGATQGDLRHGIGVPALLVVSLALTLFVHVCFHPSRGVAAAITPDAPVSRVMVALYPLLLLAPTVVGALPLIGYFDTAIELQLRILGSLLLVMVTVIVHGLARRAHLVAHRRLALRRVRRLRAHRERERLADTSAPVSGQASPSLDAGEEVARDLMRTERQTRRILADVAVLLLLLGLWLVWRTLLPAMDAPDTTIFESARTASDPLTGVGETAGVDDAAAAIAPDGISLRGVVLALFLITVGLIASRNIRGLLELAVFERLRLDAGARYAIVAIAGYVLVGASLVAGLSQLGVDWSKLQWIVAALGVGLGFGLQEIVANFVSGLIILFERPIRVGDVVTIGNLSGTVSNIRIRATTVTDFDNLEVMLPNKTIITENVTNWTLSDSVTRVILSVGVAFGSDVNRVRTLLEEAIRETRDILDEPEWAVFFMRHGEHALIFELRVFVPTPDHRLPVTHELNARLTAALKGAGIEIPHPQRSITIRERTAESR